MPGNEGLSSRSPLLWANDNNIYVFMARVYGAVSSAYTIDVMFQGL